MCKKIICTVLTLVLLIGLVPAAAIPASAASSGACGTDLTYEISGTTLIIKGKGTMTLDGAAPFWEAEKNKIERVKFEMTGPIVIPDGAFESASGTYTNLQSVHVNNISHWLGSSFKDTPMTAGGRAHNFYIGETIQGMEDPLVIPEGIVQIPANAFANATIKKISLPDSLQRINTNAFLNCYQLGSISIPNGVQAIADSAFAGCNALKRVQLSESLESLGAYAFFNCKHLTSVSGGDKLMTMGPGVFAGCTGLTSVALPTELREITANTFKDCTSLQNINVPAKVVNIHAGAFQHSGLKGISLPASVTHIDGSAFADCPAFSYINVPSVKAWCDMQIVGTNPLNYARNLRIDGENASKLELPSDLVSVPAGRFANARNVKTLMIPDSVQNIGENAFYDCQALKTVKIGNSLAVIEANAFKDCSAISKVVVNETQWANMVIKGITEDPVTGERSGGNMPLIEAYEKDHPNAQKPEGPSGTAVPVSEQLVDLVIGRTPFRDTAYEYPAGSGKYLIGYGTASIAGAKITPAEARRVLKDTGLPIVAGTVVKYIPKLAADDKQAQREALTAYTVRNGYNWLSNSQHPLRIAVDNGLTGVDLLEAMGSGAVVGTAEFNYRLCDGNLYLNGKYSNTVPDQYGAVNLDPNGGKPGRSPFMIYDKSQFPTDTVNNLAAAYNPTRLNYKFLGWFTQRDAGKLVTHADASFNGKTIYAHWQYDEAGVPGAKPVSYQLPTVMVDGSCQDSTQRVKVYALPDLTSDHIQTIDNNTLMSIVAEYLDGAGNLWVRIKDSGWTSLGKNPITMVKPGTVKLEPKQRLNVFKNNSGSIDKSTRVSSLRNGDVVSVVEFKKVDNETWGRVWFLDQSVTPAQYTHGWVDLAHVEMEKLPDQQADPDSPTGMPPISVGVVVGTDGLRVRADHDVYSQIYMKLPRNTEVDIYEKAYADNGVEWAQIMEGWVCMQYIDEKKPDSSSGSNEAGGLGSDTNTTPLATGKVIGNVLLYIRSAPGAQNKDLGTLTGGTKLTIYQTKMFNGAMWGRMERGWVCLNYVKLDKELPAPDSSNSSNGKPVTTVNLARVINCEKINIRATPSTKAALVGTIPLGYQVEYTEKTENEGYTWYRTNRGWLCGDFLMELGTKNVPNTPATPHIPGVGPVVPGAPATVGTVTGNPTVNVREDADINSDVVMELKKGSRVYIQGSKVNAGHTWYKIEQGYISSDYVNVGAMAGNETSDGTTEVANGVYATGTVAAAGVKTYIGPSAGYKEAKNLALGEKVTLYEQQLSDGVAWGRIGGSRWVNLAFVTLNGTGVTGTGTMGTVTKANHAVRIRRTPSFDGAQMCTILVGSPVEILEVQGQWGRTPQGWISMDHVNLAGAVPTPPLNPTVPTNPDPNKPGEKPKPDANRGIPFDMKGTTKDLTYLQIIPGVLGDYDAEIDAGQDVVIVKLDKVDNKLWGLVEGGWVDMDALTLQNYVVSKNAQIVWNAPNTNHAETVLNKGDVKNIQELQMDDAKKVWGRIDADKWIELTQITELSNVSTSFLVKSSTNKDTAVYAYSDTTSEKAEQPLKANSAIAISSIAMDAQGTGLMVRIAEGWVMAADVNKVAGAHVKPAMVITYNDQNRTTPAGFRYNGNTLNIDAFGLSSTGIPMGQIEGTAEWIELSALFTP